MSTRILNVITTDPWFVPEKKHIEEVLDYVKTIMPMNHDIKAEIEAIPLFIHPVENYEATYCPVCSQEITDWWWEMVNRLYKEQWFDGFNGLPMPCCGNVVSLNDVTHRSEAGFARFRIEIYDPMSPTYKNLLPDIELWDDLPDLHRIKPNTVFGIQFSTLGLQKVETIINHSVRQFWQWL